jgi:hypothetical protein
MIVLQEISLKKFHIVLLEQQDDCEVWLNEKIENMRPECCGTGLSPLKYTLFSLPQYFPYFEPLPFLNHKTL